MYATTRHLPPIQRYVRQPAHFAYELSFPRITTGEMFLFRFNASDLTPQPKACPLFVALVRLYQRGLLSGKEVGAVFGAALGKVAAREGRVR